MGRDLRARSSHAPARPITCGGPQRRFPRSVKSPVVVIGGAEPSDRCRREKAILTGGAAADNGRGRFRLRQGIGRQEEKPATHSFTSRGVDIQRGECWRRLSCRFPPVDGSLSEGILFYKKKTAFYTAPIFLDLISSHLKTWWLLWPSELFYLYMNELNGLFKAYSR